MVDIPATPPTEQVYGIAKKFTLELEKLPLHSHAAIVGMMQMMCEHRKIVLQNEIALAQKNANDAAMEEARRRHADAAADREAKERRNDERLGRNMLAEDAPRPELVKQ